MKIRRANIDLYFAACATDRNKHYVSVCRKVVEKADNDPEREKRLKTQECVICYGSSRIGGSVCTQAQCGLCDKRLSSGNSCVDVLCEECARKSGLCKHCGGDIDMKNRRKREIPERTPTQERD